MTPGAGRHGRPSGGPIGVNPISCNSGVLITTRQIGGVWFGFSPRDVGGIRFVSRLGKLGVVWFDFGTVIGFARQNSQPVDTIVSGSAGEVMPSRSIAHS